MKRKNKRNNNGKSRLSMAKISKLFNRFIKQNNAQHFLLPVSTFLRNFKNIVFIKIKGHTIIETKDMLNRELAANNIVEEIDANAGKYDEGYIFAISGRWGEGKTDLLHRIEPKLVLKGYRVIWFNPWQYTQDAETLRRVFLKTLKKQLSQIGFFELLQFKLSPRELLRRLKTKIVSLKGLDLEETRTGLNLEFLFKIIILIAIIFILLIKIFSLSTVINYFKNIPSFFTNYPVLSGILSILVALIFTPNIIQVQHKSNKVTSVDDFEKLFEKCLKPHNKIVVFVDDLDRCTPEGIKLVLDTLKTFFRTKKASFVVTGDHGVLERYIGKELKVASIYKQDGSGNIEPEATELAEKLEGRRFLQKLFNVYWKLPQLDPSDAINITNSHIKTIEIAEEEKAKILNLTTIFLERNLRDIERFISILRFTLKDIDNRINYLEAKQQQTVTDKIVVKNLKEVTAIPSLLAKVLIIQEKFDTEFEAFSKDPALYYKLEMEQLRNAPGEETQKSQNRLRNRFNDFTALVKTEPTFYKNDRVVLEHSPEIFFYYSGFTGTAESGLLSEGFISRYINTDQELINDLKKASPPQIKGMVSTGISNLNNISEQNQLNQAILNLLQIFSDKELTIHELLNDFLTNQKVLDYYNSQGDPQKDEFVNTLAGSIIEKSISEILRKLMFEDPWKQKKQILWNYLNSITNSDEVLSVFLEDIEQEQQAGVDVSVKTSNILTECINVLKSPDNFSSDQLSIVTERLKNTLKTLNPQNFADNNLFKSIVDQIKVNSQEYRKKEILALFLLKENSIWVNIQKPQSELNLMKKGTKLRNSKLGRIIGQVYESWSK